MGNGDSIKQVVDTYGGLANGNNLISHAAILTIANAWANSVPTTQLCQGLINLYRSRELKMTALSFDGNWLLESSYDANRAQLVSINHFFGEISLLD